MKLKLTPSGLLTIGLMTGGLMTGLGCVDGDNSGIPHFQKPTDLLITSADVTFDGAARRLGYVSNFASGTISVFDVRNRRIFDTDPFDDEETPLTVGGRPIQVLEWKPTSLSGDTKFKLIAVDQENKRLVVINMDNVKDANNERVLSHKFANMGGAEVTTVSTPQFFDQGRASNPSITDITLKTATAKVENWKVRNRNEGEWLVEGSISGEQTNRVIPGKPYVSDTGAIAFTLFEGERTADSNDAYFFGVVKFKPLPLSIHPAVVRRIDDQLLVADRDSGLVQSIDLNSKTVTGTVTLDDGTGEAILVSSLASSGNTLFVGNRGLGNSLFVVDTDLMVASFFIVGFRTHSLLHKSGEVLMMPLNELKVRLFDTASTTLLPDKITMANTPALALSLKGDEGVDGDAFIINQDNSIDLVDVAKRKRIDTQDLGDSESFAGPVLFYDKGADSNPALVDIITQDGVTKTEDWLLSFEGVVSGNVSSLGVVSGAQLSDPSADFIGNHVQVGDTVVLNPNQGSLKEELLVDSIVDAQTLNLASTPDSSGTGTSYEIRATKSYTMVGSTSGFQRARVEEGKSSQSDNDQITFSVSPASTSSPTTRGDYFSFATNDGITPIASDGDLPVDSVLFEQQAYILNQNSNDITIVSVPNLQVTGGIN